MYWYSVHITCTILSVYNTTLYKKNMLVPYHADAA